MGRTECTILTLNIFHDLPMYRHLPRRCELIAKAIAAHRPHVAALQEVLRATGSGDIGAETPRPRQPALRRRGLPARLRSWPTAPATVSSPLTRASRS